MRRVVLYHVCGPDGTACDDTTFNCRLGHYKFSREIARDMRYICCGLTKNVLRTLALSAISRERRLDTYYSEYWDNRLSFTPQEPSRTPQSPLCFPAAGFGINFDPSQCPPRTLSLLHKVCDLTSCARDIVSLRQSELYDPAFQFHQNATQKLLDVEGQVGELLATIRTFADLTDSDDDPIYESCRIAAVIYATSITHKVSLMESAECLNRRSDQQVSVSKLVEMLQRTNLVDCWDNMIGVLLWATLVGGAAAKEPREKNWLMAVAARCCITLLVEHRNPLLESIRVMMEVMRLWTDMRMSP